MSKVKVTSFKKKDKNEKMRPFGLPEKYYDFDKKIKEELSLRNICNQFIHSYYFQILSNKRGKIRSIEFVSNDYKDKCIYCLEIKYFLKLVLSIINETVKSVRTYQDKNHPDGYRIECC